MLAAIADRVEIRQESMKPLEGVKNDADSKTEEQSESGGSMGCVQAMLQTIQANERLAATHGRWSKERGGAIGCSGSHHGAGLTAGRNVLFEAGTQVYCLKSRLT